MFGDTARGILFVAILVVSSVANGDLIRWDWRGTLYLDFDESPAGCRGTDAELCRSLDRTTFHGGLTFDDTVVDGRPDDNRVGVYSIVGTMSLVVDGLFAHFYAGAMTIQVDLRREIEHRLGIFPGIGTEIGVAPSAGGPARAVESHFDFPLELRYELVSPPVFPDDSLPANPPPADTDNLFRELGVRVSGGYFVVDFEEIVRVPDPDTLGLLALGLGGALFMRRRGHHAQPLLGIHRATRIGTIAMAQSHWSTNGFESSPATP